METGLHPVRSITAGVLHDANEKPCQDGNTPIRFDGSPVSRAALRQDGNHQAGCR